MCGNVYILLNFKLVERFKYIVINKLIYLWIFVYLYKVINAIFIDEFFNMYKNSLKGIYFRYCCSSCDSVVCWYGYVY